MHTSTMMVVTFATNTNRKLASNKQKASWNLV